MYKVDYNCYKKASKDLKSEVYSCINRYNNWLDGSNGLLISFDKFKKEVNREVGK